MSSATVRSDYDQLKQASSSFKSQASALEGMNKNILSCYSTLESGDWIGKGSTAFQNEMKSSVLPTLKRLQSALDTAANVTNQISQLMKQAEDEASGVLHL